MTQLEAREVTCGYNGRAVLRELSLATRKGEVLALIGPNGAGKTTLLRALARLMRPGEGVVLLDDRDLWRLPPGVVARRVAVAPQTEGASWPLTVEQAVVLGRAPHRGWLLPYSSADWQSVEKALRMTGMEPLRHRLVAELSGGEQRRVVLARALAQEPRVLLLDEPTTHLDLKYQAEVLDLVQRLAHQGGLSVVVTMHDLNHAAMCADRVALLVSGSLLAVGLPAEVLTPERLACAYGVPVAVTRHPVYGTPMVTPLVDQFGRGGT